MNNKGDETLGSNIRKSWSAPTVRAVVPVRRTQGGGGNRNDQDDRFYDLS